MADGAGRLKFVLDSNLGLPVRESPWPEILRGLGIEAEESNDLPRIDGRMDRHEFDVGYVPIADFHRLARRGDRHYRGLAIATSKFTGTARLPSALVVRKDDPAAGIDDLAGSDYGYINKSCSSSYFPPAILLGRQGRRLDAVLHIKPVKPWQGQVDAVASGQVRSTMVPEDVWRTDPDNASKTRIIGRYDTATPPVVIARRTLPEGVAKSLLDALADQAPAWGAVYGPFRPFYRADVHAFFHDLDQLPADL